VAALDETDAQRAQHLGVHDRDASRVDAVERALGRAASSSIPPASRAGSGRAEGSRR
jgi:hypothetical protein